MPDIIQTLEQDVAVAWADIQKGVHWLEHEATVLEAWVQHADPAVSKNIQNIVKQGEAGAQVLAQYTGDALSGIVAAGAADAETLVANFLQGAFSGNIGAILTKAGQSVATDSGTILQSLIHVGLAKVMAGIASTTSPPA